MESIERVESIRMNTLPRLLSLFQSLPTPPKSMFALIDRLISRFIWKDKKPWVILRLHPCQCPPVQRASQPKISLEIGQRSRGASKEVQHVKLPYDLSALTHFNLHFVHQLIRNNNFKSFEQLKADFNLPKTEMFRLGMHQSTFFQLIHRSDTLDFDICRYRVPNRYQC